MTDVAHQDRAHAKLSASGAARWMACPGSVSLEADLPNTSSVHADEGTAAHELAEAALQAEKDAIDFKGQTFNGSFIADDEMCENVQVYLDYVRSHKGRHFFEKRVSFDDWVPDGFGTADAITLGDDGVLYVSDLKYGKGVRVDAEWNPQGLLYALGVVAAFEMIWEVQAIQIAIVQPRMDNISEFTIDRDELVEWADTKVKEAVEGAFADEPTFNPSEKACQWCKAKGNCRALAAFNFELAGVEFADVATGRVEFSDTPTMNNAELAAVLPHLKLLRKWADGAEAHAQTELEAGRDVPGFKLVEGRANRKWEDEEDVGPKLARKLGGKAEAYKSTLITPAQAEKKIGGDAGKKWVAKLTTKPTGKPTMAPESDKRPAVGVNVEDEFANIAAE